MKNSIYIIYCLGIFASCNSEKITQKDNLINLNEGLVVNIPFNNSYLETISNTEGINTKTIFIQDRKQQANQAIYLNRNDSAIVDFGD